PPPMLPPASPLPVAPLVAQRSVRLYSGAELPSAAAPTGPVGRGGSAGGTADAVVPVRWDSPGPAAGPPVQRAAASDPPGVPATGLPRTDTAGPSSSRATVQRSLGPAAPGSFRNAGDVAVASGVGRRAADGSVVFNHLMVQRDEAGETGMTPEPPPEPAVFDPAGMPTTDTQVPAQPPDEAPPGEPPPGPASPADDHAPGHPDDGKPPVVTDELVRALYPPLSRMIRADLRLERERAGFLIDTRH
ncbi:MAG: hypothetical protein HOV68_06915, partial [Streptomycetaceae bacterium]|nr:hypothetical protein [Streptomycetaceae bacterium]